MRAAEAHKVFGMPLFQHLAQNSLDALSGVAFFQRLPARSVICSEGDPADFFYIVEEGSVELLAQHAGRTTTLAIVAPIGSFGLVEAVFDAPYNTCARTLEPSRVLMIPASALRRALENDPMLAHAIISELGTICIDSVRQLKNQKLRQSVERLASWLVRQHRELDGADHFDLPFDKRTLASYLGMTPENLARGFATLADCGIAVEGRRITFNDVSEIERIGKPNALIDCSGASVRSASIKAGGGGLLS
jgi:CRP/FNR family transcriptional regulator, transcriptional activator FtrB